MFIFTRTLVTYARTIFKPCCCFNFQSMRTQAESTDIAFVWTDQDEDTVVKFSAYAHY